MADTPNSRDRRRLPRFAAGTRREKNRFLVMLAHDPMFNTQKSPRISYAGRKVLGKQWLAGRGPWLVVLCRDDFNDEQPSYKVLRLVPVTSSWGHKSTDLRQMREAARQEVASIVREWNDSPLATGENMMGDQEWTNRERPW